MRLLPGRPPQTLQLPEGPFLGQRPAGHSPPCHTGGHLLGAIQLVTQRTRSKPGLRAAGPSQKNPSTPPDILPPFPTAAL